MAKRKTHRKHRRKYRRIGAMKLQPKSPILQIGSVAVGWLMADTINTGIDKFTGTLDKKIVGATETGLGAAVMLAKLGKKKTIIETIGGGILAGAGLKRLLKEFGVISGISGYQAVPVIGVKRMNGYQSVPVIGKHRMNGYTTATAALNGYEVPNKANVMGSTGSGLTPSFSGSSYAD
jgi:hypothetical protein